MKLLTVGLLALGIVGASWHVAQAQAVPEGAASAGLPSPEEILRKKAELEERTRKVELLRQPAPPEQLAELEERRKALEDLERRFARAALALQLTEAALRTLEQAGGDAIRIQGYRLQGAWGTVNGEALLREQPDVRAGQLRALTTGEPVYVLAEVHTEAPWFLLATARDGIVGFTNRTFVQTAEEEVR